MKVIFLDIDGVLNVFHCEKPTYLHRKEHFEPKLVKNLEKIIAKTNAYIVISSSWHWGAKELLEQANFKYLDKIIDVTPRDKRWRGEQIKQWIDKHKPDNYIVLDDEIFDICGEYCNVIPKEKVIEIPCSIGLSEKHIEKIISIL